MEEQKNRIKGIVGTLIFHLAIIFILFLLALRTPLPLPGEEVVEVSLGYAETGSGLVQPIELAPVQKAEHTKPNTQTNDILTQEVEEAPAIEDVKPKEVKKTVEEEKPVKEDPVVNPRALYTPHQTDSKETGGQGDDNNPADQGKTTGSNQSTKPDGIGGLGSGISFSLEGRGSIHLPKPAYNSQEQGRVVVRIWVNKEGKVERAVSGVQGTTITDQTLIKLAQDAALKAVFNSDPNAADQQTGTITYNFIRLN